MTPNPKAGKKKWSLRLCLFRARVEPVSSLVFLLVIELERPYFLVTDPKNAQSIVDMVSGNISL